MGRAFRIVDAFAAEPLKGNPVAVVIDAEGLDSETMQAIARWTNLSETTFYLPPTTANADYRLRIFTPDKELPFAGHPTLGSAHALLETGRISPHANRVIQECGAGLVPIAIGTQSGQPPLSLLLPEARMDPLSAEAVAELEAILGSRVDPAAAPSIVDVGAVWIVAALPSVEALLAVSPDLGRSARLERRLGANGVTIFARREDGPSQLEVRSFAPSCGVGEDPVCGSGNGSVAVFQLGHGLLPPGTGYEASQGRCVGRDGRVRVSTETDGRVMVGGACVTCLVGELQV